MCLLGTVASNQRVVQQMKMADLLDVFQADSVECDQYQ